MADRTHAGRSYPTNARNRRGYARPEPPPSAEPRHLRPLCAGPRRALALALGVGGFFLLGQLSPTPEGTTPQPQRQEESVAEAAGAGRRAPRRRVPLPLPMQPARQPGKPRRARCAASLPGARNSRITVPPFGPKGELAALTQRAEAGDSAFLAGELEAALGAYEAALKGAEALWATLPVRQAAQATEAAARLEANEFAAAGAAYALLRAMAGDNTALREDAARGLRRAELRPAVLAALARAEIALTNEDWSAADTYLKEARSLDGEAPGVATLSATLNRERRRQAYETALKDGYDALARQDYAGAEGEFKESPDAR
jgi:tetratricopeptide (TPR) repeat protein